MTRMGRPFVVVPVCALLLASCKLDRVGTGELTGETADASEETSYADSPPADALDELDAAADVSEDASMDADADAAADAETCAPLTCAALGASCGAPSDGCGAALQCGDCSAPAGCHDGRCIVVRYVLAGGAGAKDGASWDNALPTVQAAVDIAQPEDEVWVGQGTYFAASAAAPVVKLNIGVKLFGGFAGVEVDRAERDLSLYQSVLDGLNAGRVVVGASDSLIDGFVLRAGWVGDSGGGMQVTSAQNQVIRNCRFLQHYASAWGGGLYALLSTVSISHSSFEGNNARQGGGIFNDHGELTVDSCLFHGNTVDYNSGGGGALFNYDAPATVTNSIFVRNKSTPYYGGAVYNSGDKAFRFVNCTFHENAADTYGGAVFDNVGAKPTLVNCILWGNTPDQVYDWPGSGPPDIRYSDVDGIDGGTGNISASPGFVDPLSSLLSLTAGSPCIDSADGTEAPPVDSTGAPRVDDPATPNTGAGDPPYADMGAFEYQP